MDNDNREINKPVYKKYKGLLIFLLLLVAIASYFGLQKYGEQLSKMNIFTKYPARSKTALPAGATKAEIEAANRYLENIYFDSIPGEDSIRNADVVLKEEPVEEAKQKLKPIAKPPEREVPLKKEDSSVKTPSSIDFFDELLPLKEKSEEDRVAFQQLYEKEILSSKTLFKLAAIAGKEVLQNKLSGMEILETLEMEEGVTGIILCDLHGKIVYATNGKFKNKYLSAVLPAFQINEEVINWITKDGRTSTQVPIYATYGKIGAIIIITIS